MTGGIGFDPANDRCHVQGVLRGLGLLCVSCLVVGCTRMNPLFTDSTGGETADETGATISESSGPGSTSTDSGKTTGSTTRPDSTASGDATGPSGPDDTSVGPDDTGEQTTSTTGPDPVTCSTYVQDCPAGDEKCMPWANDGGTTWNALGCFPIDPSPGVPGDVCMVEGSAFSGVDDCDESSMCWNVDDETGEGTCVPFCQGSEDSPICEDVARQCIQSSDGVVAVCLNVCNPLLQDCNNGLACVPATEGFVCVPSINDEPQPGAPCEVVNACGAGGLCVVSDALVGCEATSCCTQFCDLSEADPCPGLAVCLPYYEMGAAPAGYENVGICGAPA